VVYIENLQVEYLAYSYLYYVKNISAISDSHYDQICKWLYDRMTNKVAKETKYYNLCKDLDASGSAFYLKEEDYPEYIIKVAYKLYRQSVEKREIKMEELDTSIYDWINKV
jgi:hypothetical protein